MKTVHDCHGVKSCVGLGLSNSLEVWILGLRAEVEASGIEGITLVPSRKSELEPAAVNRNEKPWRETLIDRVEQERERERTVFMVRRPGGLERSYLSMERPGVDELCRGLKEWP